MDSEFECIVFELTLYLTGPVFGSLLYFYAVTPFPNILQIFFQDERSRISLVVDHAQGAASWQQVRIGT